MFLNVIYKNHICLENTEWINLLIHSRYQKPTSSAEEKTQEQSSMTLLDDINTDITHILLPTFRLDAVTNDATKTSIHQKVHTLLSTPVGALVNNDIHHVFWKSPTVDSTTFYHTNSNLNNTTLQIMMDCGTSSFFSLFTTFPYMI